jgi:hypothetical protein
LGTNRVSGFRDSRSGVAWSTQLPKSRREKRQKVGPKYQSEDTCGGSQRRGQASAKIPKGHRSRIPWDVEPISAFRHFRVRGIIREEERLLVVRSKSRKPKLVGNRWHVLVALEQSTFVDVSHFGIFQELWKYIGTLQLPKPEVLCGLNKGFD